MTTRTSLRRFGVLFAALLLGGAYIPKVSAAEITVMISGAITPSEIMQAMDMGLYDLKFFPSDSAGGIAGLNYMAGPFPDVMFCPTGMVTQGLERLGERAGADRRADPAHEV